MTEGRVARAISALTGIRVRGRIPGNDRAYWLGVGWAVLAALASAYWLIADPGQAGLWLGVVIAAGLTGGVVLCALGFNLLARVRVKSVSPGRSAGSLVAAYDRAWQLWFRGQGLLWAALSAGIPWMALAAFGPIAAVIGLWIVGAAVALICVALCLPKAPPMAGIGWFISGDGRRLRWAGIALQAFGPGARFAGSRQADLRAAPDGITLLSRMATAVERDRQGLGTMRLPPMPGLQKALSSELRLRFAGWCRTAAVPAISAVFVVALGLPGADWLRDQVADPAALGQPSAGLASSTAGAAPAIAHVLPDAAIEEAVIEEAVMPDERQDRRSGESNSGPGSLSPIGPTADQPYSDVDRGGLADPDGSDEAKPGAMSDANSPDRGDASPSEIGADRSLAGDRLQSAANGGEGAEAQTAEAAPSTDNASDQKGSPFGSGIGFDLEGPTHGTAILSRPPDRTIVLTPPASTGAGPRATAEGAGERSQARLDRDNGNGDSPVLADGLALRLPRDEPNRETVPGSSAGEAGGRNMAMSAPLTAAEPRDAVSRQPLPAWIARLMSDHHPR